MTVASFMTNSAILASLDEFRPILLIEVELSRPLPAQPLINPKTGECYSYAMALIRLHSHPLGMLNIDASHGTIDAARLAGLIWESFANQIRAHLDRDEIALKEPLDVHGLETPSTPPCLFERKELLLSSPFVSVVVATCNQMSQLQDCIHSLLSLDYPNYEIVVVDNAPDPSDAHDLWSLASVTPYKLRYIREGTPGLAVAHNRALTEIDSSIVAFTDDDVIVDPGWLTSIVTNFQKDPEIACVTGMILPLELETSSQMWIEQFGGFSKGFQRTLFDVRDNHPGEALFPFTAGRFGSGANMAFRTDALRQIGGFDPALGAGTPAMGADDLAVFFEVIVNGYRLAYEPRAIVHHKHRRDFHALVRQSYGYGVGLSSFLMKTIMDKPSRFFEILMKTPAGLKYLLDPRSKKNQKKQKGYPAELNQSELMGFVVGPFAYLKSRLRIQKLGEQLPTVRVTKKKFPSVY